MKTSTPWPDSSESYAIHRPSGESVGCPRLNPLAIGEVAMHHLDRHLPVVAAIVREKHVRHPT